MEPAVEEDVVIGAIEHVLFLWPRDLNEPEDGIRARLGGRIDEALPLSSLRAIARGSWRCGGPPRVREGIAKCLLTDSKWPAHRAMIELRLRSGQWVLTSIEVECPCCFGTGINEGCVCDLCFGAGWGVAE